MKPILLLVDGKRYRNQLAQWLSRLYEVVVADQTPELNMHFAVMIVDLPALEKHKQWVELRRAMGYPVISPILLVTSRRGMQKITNVMWNLIDDLIITPLDPAELQARIDHMIQIRRFSLELKHNNETLTRIQAAIESTGDAVSIADPEGVAIYQNQAFSDLYGYTLEELNVRGIPDTLFVDPAVARNVLDTLREGESWSGEVELRRKTGQRMSALLRADDITNENGESIGFVAVYTDMNRLRQIEASERQHRILSEALRDSIAIITSTLEVDEVLDRILEQVGQVVAHDAANIMLIEAGEAYLARSRGYGSEAFENGLNSRRFPVAESPVLSSMVTMREPAIVGDIRHATLMTVTSEEVFRGFVGAPIFSRHKVIGLINLYSKNANFFTEADADRLMTFAHLAGTAVENARLFAQAQELAVFKERQRMAQNLHDAVSQTLFSASGIAEVLPRIWQKDPAQVWPRLKQLERLTRGALAEMRTLLYELRPAAIHDADLPHLIRQLAEGAMGRSSTEVSVIIDVDPDVRIPEDVHENFYHITQEGLNNIIKHARATEATIDLHADADTVRLIIRDNGRGFEPGQRANTSLGMKIMNERAAAIGATLEFESRLGYGTTVTASWSNGKEGTRS